LLRWVATKCSRRTTHTRSHKKPSEHAARQAPGQAPPGQAVKPTSRVDGKVPPIPLHRRIWP
jgi:hypothetical protein